MLYQAWSKIAMDLDKRRWFFVPWSSTVRYFVGSNRSCRNISAYWCTISTRIIIIPFQDLDTIHAAKAAHSFCFCLIRIHYLSLSTNLPQISTHHIKVHCFCRWNLIFVSNSEAFATFQSWGACTARGVRVQRQLLRCRTCWSRGNCYGTIYG